MAHWLRDRGFEAYAVRGGIEGYLSGAVAELPQPSVSAQVATRRAFGALRHRFFRRYSLGVLLSLTGNWVEAAAFGYVVLLLGGSAATLGLIGFLNTIPNLVFALPGGTLADRYDRRKLLLAFQGANMAVAATLAVLWATGELTVALMGVLAVAGGTLGTLSYPAFQGLLASTVPPRELESAVAINSLSLQVARFVGPAIAGVLLGSAGPTWVFAVNAASFVAVLGTVALLPPARPVARAAERIGSGIRAAARYVFGQRSMASLIALLLFAGLFATPPVAFMLPGIVRFKLHEGGGTLGLLFALIGLGSLLGSLALLKLAGRVNKGEPLLASYFGTALAIAAIGASPWTPLSLALGLVGGFGGVVFVGLSTVAVQTMASDEMRARVTAIWAVAFVGMLPIGALVTAGLAAWFGSGGAVLVDGVATIVGGLAVLAFRPEIAWLGCAALPASCVAATSPVAVWEEEQELAAIGSGSV